MKPFTMAALAALAFSAAAAPVSAGEAAPAPTQTSAARTPTEAENARIVVAFYDLAFNQHRPTEAARLYIGDRYIQHNSAVPNGGAAFYGYFEGFFRDNPQSRATIHRVIVDGDLVALHVHSQETPDDPGRAIVDIFRVENGKIVEHFDVIQTVPATTANGNTMFSGDKAD
ncbi:Possible membrane protein [Brevundimonas diminuta 3F5N]|uniref:Possible membrane protein n=1 Tax=Brevundimonas diminuta 3F5N TaxID=1255603 RepID=A0A1R4F731_BREDI|nr:nuclear transport factor 2 family protein [Brevundimonas diminuta]SJM51612.1 Possible membrane protein [Brevundimonas diminuta 3F5N]